MEKKLVEIITTNTHLIIWNDRWIYWHSNAFLENGKELKLADFGCLFSTVAYCHDPSTKASPFLVTQTAWDYPAARLQPYIVTIQF